MKTFAVNVERQRRKNYQRTSAKIVATRSPSLSFQDMRGNLSAEISSETAVIAVNFPRNAGKRRYFSTKYR